MNYEQAVARLFDLPRFTKKHPLDHTKEFLDRLQGPAFSIPAIHVAGTNGKGSVCAFLTNVLEEAGLRVGTFTSPHLVKPNERICIGGRPVSDEVFLWAYEQTVPTAEQMEQEGSGYPTFFEMMFAMAMVIFQKEQVDCLVLETGLGGRLDATNAVTPAVCAVTSVSLDHMQYLGDTVEEIAAEKAGIIKAGVPVVYDASAEAPAQVLAQAALEKGALVCPITEEVFEITERAHNRIRIETAWGALSVPFAADYQLLNACVAAKTAEVFLQKMEAVKNRETALRKEVCRSQIHAWIQTGIAKTKWPARMEEILPGVYLDGAHNEDGVRRFCETVEKQPGSKCLLFSVVADKAFEGMVEALSRVGFEKVMITHMENSRSLSLEELRAVCSWYFGERAVFQGDLKKALTEFLTWKEAGNCLYIAGSLYLAGDIKKILSDETENLC